MSPFDIVPTTNPCARALATEFIGTGYHVFFGLDARHVHGLGPGALGIVKRDSNIGQQQASARKITQ